MTFNEEYQAGIKARRDGQAKHENPYIGGIGFFARNNKDWWDIGWEAEDSHQRRSGNSVASRKA